MEWRFWRKKSATSFSFVPKTTNSFVTAEDTLEKVEYVYDCIRTRAQKIASIPWHIWNGDRIDEKYEQMFKNPNPYQTSTQFLESIVAWLDLRGVAFVLLNFPMAEILDADLVYWRYENGKMYYQYAGKTFTDEQVKTIKNFTPYSRFRPLSVIDVAFGSVKLMEDYEEAISKLMEKGAYVPAILTSDQVFTKTQIEQIQEEWKALSGPANAGRKIPVLGGGLDVKKIGLTPADLDTLQRESITKDRIYTAFGVPKRDFQNLNRATAEVQQEYFVRTTIMPFADSIAEQITKFILNSEREFKFDYSQLPEMQGDLLTKAQADEINIRSGIRYINELRQRDGLEPVSWGNSWWGGITTTPLGTAQEGKELNEVVGKIYSLYSDMKKSVEEERKDSIWKAFISRTTPQENKFKSELKKLFTRQEKEFLESIKSYKIREKIFDWDKWVEIFKKMAIPLYLAFAQQSVDATMELYGFSIAFDLHNPRAQALLAEKAFKFAKEVNDTTKEALRKELNEALANGESLRQVSERVAKVFEEARTYRTDRIARTEVIGVNNWASFETAKENGIKTKVWLTAHDERTRPWHGEADGQKVGILEPFIVNGEPLDFPGDSKGSPENIINCRCVITYETEV